VSAPTDLVGLADMTRGRLLVRGMLRSLASTVVLLALYFMSPLDRMDRVPVAVSLVVALLLLLGVSMWQFRAITRAAAPAVRAVEALAVTAPLFLLLFSATYFLLARDDAANFNTPRLTRTDALYFTVTVFATVGFGDIVATSQVARRLVTAQMVLDLLVLGLGIRVIVAAVQRGRQYPRPAPDAPHADRS
jgi:voltage-gated potassium channel